MDTFFALLAVLALAAFFVLKCRVPSGVAPLISLSAVILGVSLSGVAGLLVPGTVAVYLLCFGLCAFALLYKRKPGQWKNLLSPGMVFFVLAGLSMLVYFAIRQPLTSEWDEWSFWATAVKLTKYNGHLYTSAEMGWSWVATQTPAMPLLSYFFQFFGGYAVWKIYTAYGLLMLACIASLMGTLRFKNYKLAVPVGVIGLLTPWFFTVYYRVIYVETTWLTSYGDIVSGMVFGGAVLVYLALRKNKAPLWPVALVLAALALVKDNTFLFALVAAGIIGMDLLFFGDRPEHPAPLHKRIRARFTKGGFLRRTKGPARPLAGRLLRAAVLLVVAVLPYFIWMAHYTPIIAALDVAGGTGTTSLSLDQVVVQGFQMLLSPAARSEQFTMALNKLTDAFLHTQLTMLPSFSIGGFMVGSGLMVSALVVAMFLAAALFTKDRQLRRRTLLAMVLSTAGFFAYYLELLFSYALIFKWGQTENLDSYNRYVQPYYIAWFLMALGFVVLAAKRERVFNLLSGAVLALCVVMLVRTNTLLGTQYTVIGYPEAQYDDARILKRTADEVLEVVRADGGDESSRLFIVTQGDDGQRWFRFSYELLPNILDYSASGGGTLGPPDADLESTLPYYTPFTLEEYAQTILDSGSEYLFVDNVDELFKETYGSLFADGLAAYGVGRTPVYRVEPAGESVLLVPVETEVAG